jgi:hypothetical protein
MVKGVLRGLERKVNLLRWDFFNANSMASFANEAHLVVARNPVYAKIALTCILSFLHFNERARIVLHCDIETCEEMTKLVKRRMRRNQIQVLDDLDPKDSWQISKLKVILGLPGTNNVFMDADLRWNGSLKSPEALTFYVPEFQLSKKSPYRQILANISVPMSPEVIMKNTSFLAFSGVALSIAAKSEVLRLNAEFEGILAMCDIGDLDKPLLMRLSEQIVLSVLSESWETEIKYLKEVDGHKDGQFVESSYFGATGSVF